VTYITNIYGGGASLEAAPHARRRIVRDAVGVPACSPLFEPEMLCGLHPFALERFRQSLVVADAAAQASLGLDHYERAILGRCEVALDHLDRCLRE
jgi:hypothetical protein